MFHRRSTLDFEKCCIFYIRFWCCIFLWDWVFFIKGFYLLPFSFGSCGVFYLTFSCFFLIIDIDQCIGELLTERWRGHDILPNLYQKVQEKSSAVLSEHYPYPKFAVLAKNVADYYTND